MFIVGITGGIGSGKTVISKVFAAFGIPVYNADTRAKIIQEQNVSVIEQTKQLLGTEAYLQNGALNRAYIASKVFEQPQLRSGLNAIVHPAVANDFNDWIASNQNAPYLIKESALLIESEAYKKVQYVLLVTADALIRMQRVLKRDPFRTAHEVQQILNAQRELPQNWVYPHTVIINDNSVLLLPKLTQLHAQFLNHNVHES